jgi:hypothetical protein
MTMCPNSKKACECQPQDGVMCPHGPTPNDWKPWPDRVGAEGWRRLAEAQHALLTLGKVDPLPADAITVNLVRLAGLDKHKARECEAIVRQVLAAHGVAGTPGDKP